MTLVDRVEVGMVFGKMNFRSKRHITNLIYIFGQLKRYRTYYRIDINISNMHVLYPSQASYGPDRT